MGGEFQGRRRAWRGSRGMHVIYLRQPAKEPTSWRTSVKKQEILLERKIWDSGEVLVGARLGLKLLDKVIESRDLGRRHQVGRSTGERNLLCISNGSSASAPARCGLK